jgi:hypothetical protein
MDWSVFLDNVMVYGFWIGLGFGVSWLIRKLAG